MERTRAWLESEGLDGVVLFGREHFAWLTAGGDNHVARHERKGAAGLWVSADEMAVVTTEIEAPRIEAEELDGLPDVQVRAWPWYESEAEALRRMKGGGRWAGDVAVEGFEALPQSFHALRWELLPPEVERYRTVGRETGAALEEAARQVRPGQTEYEIAATISRQCERRGLEATVVLVGCDERIRRFRHPTATDFACQRMAMLIVCARRHGLVAAATRIVHFGSVSEDLAARHRAVAEIEAKAVAATAPGRSAGEIFQVIQQAYADAGFPDEWRLHHQGGAIGYENREWIAVPGAEERVAAVQAFAWNPSITGTKSEDTYLISADGSECLTRGDWPTLSVEAGGRVFERPDILEVQ